VHHDEPLFSFRIRVPFIVLLGCVWCAPVSPCSLVRARAEGASEEITVQIALMSDVAESFFSLLTIDNFELEIRLPSSCPTATMAGLTAPLAYA